MPTDANFVIELMRKYMIAESVAGELVVASCVIAELMHGKHRQYLGFMTALVVVKHFRHFLSKVKTNFIDSG